MAVLIEGMEMPKGKPICIIIDQAGQVRRYDLNNDKYEDDELFEAIPIPEPHGDLIDASEKIRVQMYDDEHEDFHTEEMTIDDLLSQSWVEAYAFPIIPASEEE